MWKCLLFAFGSDHSELRARRSSASEGKDCRARETRKARVAPSFCLSLARTFRILFVTEWLYERLGPPIISSSFFSPSALGRTSPFTLYRAALGIKNSKASPVPVRLRTRTVCGRSWIAKSSGKRNGGLRARVLL
ncbi:uncharacterized [Tachysurus ichikawai]